MDGLQRMKGVPAIAPRLGTTRSEPR